MANLAAGQSKSAGQIFPTCLQYAMPQLPNFAYDALISNNNNPSKGSNICSGFTRFAPLQSNNNMQPVLATTLDMS